MPIVPEKLNSRQEVRNAISSQFWDQTVHSARSLDGTARTLACEPPPVGQTAASGLLRSQELLTTQAAGVPVMPGYCKQHGGVVSYLITGSVCAVDVSLSTYVDTAGFLWLRLCMLHLCCICSTLVRQCIGSKLPQTFTGAGQGLGQSWRKAMVGKFVWQS